MIGEKLKKQIDFSQEVILVVDDVPINIQFLVGLLSPHYKIMVAKSGQRCVELATGKNPPSLILLDVEMPEMKGYQACKLLKEHPVSSDIPVIFVTAKDSEEEEEYGLKIGAVDYITKPINPTITLARVNTQLKVKKQTDMLNELAMKDPLTGLFNRYALDEFAEKQIKQAQRHDIPLSVVMFDIDYFKQVNDQHGHPAGDEALVKISEVVTANVRGEDKVGRFGGEEFVILLSHCGLSEAGKKAESLRQAIEELSLEFGNVTASFGVASLDDKNNSFSELCKSADDALYAAKGAGRNCVELYDSQKNVVPKDKTT